MAAPRLAFGPGMRRLTQFLGPPEERWEMLLGLALVVGLGSGASAVGLHVSVHALFGLLEPHRGGALAVILPALGAVAGVAVVAHLFREPPGHGVPDVIRAVCRQGGRMRARSIFSRWVGSLLNVSSGGSAGLEGPIVFTGAAIGSTVGGRLGLDDRRRSVLLACGVAGGISGIFNAPLTGMVFATEVVLAEWSALSIVPVIVSAVAAAEVSRLILPGQQPFPSAPFGMGAADLLACVGLGVMCGFASAGMTRSIALFHRLLARLRGSRYLAPALAGLAVGAIGLVAPLSIGDGYPTAQSAIQNQLEGGLFFALGLALAKILASALTLGSGAPGGVFAPCLATGAVLGAAYFRAAGQLLPDASLIKEGSFALVGMSGLVAGVMQAPLTGILLVMEVTRSYEIVLPLMIVSVLSLLVARRFERWSMYTRELAEQGELLRPGTDRRILADVSVRESLDAEVTTVREELSLTAFARVVKDSRRNHFPVLAGDGETLVGMLDLATVRQLLLDPEVARVTLVGTMMTRAPERVQAASSLAQAMEVFEETGAWVLPVVDGTRFVGLISRSTLFDV